MFTTRTLALVVLAFISLACAQRAGAAGFGNAFTYQGELRDGANIVNGPHDFRFHLWNAETGGSLVAPNPVDINGVQVSNGRFTIDLNFGAGPFDGGARWLQIGVKASGGASYQFLAPRQRIAPVPHALVAAGLSLPTGASGNTDDAIVQSGLFRITQAGSSNAIYAQATGALGTAGYFINSSPDSEDAALHVRNAGGGTALYATSSAFRAGHFEITNPANQHIALYASTQGTGTALYGYSTSSGYGVQGANNGSGPAAKFFINNVNNNAAALIAETNGDGPALRARSTGDGPAIEIDGSIRVSGAGNNTSTPVFRHIAAGGNLTLHFDDYYHATIINNPMCNGRPDAMLIVTEVAPSPQSAYQNIRAASLAVGYHQDTGRWWIISESTGGAEGLAAMDEGDVFNVLVVYP